MDAAGVIHLVCEGVGLTLLYLTFDGSSWTTETLPANLGGAAAVRIARSPYGDVVLAYAFIDVTGTHMGVSTRTQAGWVHEFVDPSRRTVSQDDIGLAIAADGSPRIAYNIKWTVNQAEWGLPAGVGWLRYAMPGTSVPTDAVGRALS